MKINLDLRKELWERFSLDNASLTPKAAEKLKEIYKTILEGEELIVENPDDTFLKINNIDEFKEWLIKEYDELFTKIILE